MNDLKPQAPRIAPLGAFLALAFVATPGFGSDAVDGATYRCPNNDYKNTISAKEAERLGCKRLEGGRFDIQTRASRAGRRRNAGAEASGKPRRESTPAGRTCPRHTGGDLDRSQNAGPGSPREREYNGDAGRQGNEQNTEVRRSRA